MRDEWGGCATKSLRPDVSRLRILFAQLRQHGLHSKLAARPSQYGWIALVKAASTIPIECSCLQSTLICGYPPTARPTIGWSRLRGWYVRSLTLNDRPPYSSEDISHFTMDTKRSSRKV